MIPGAVRLWLRVAFGWGTRKIGADDAEHIALPAAEHAALLERLRSAEAALRGALPVLIHIDPPCDGVRWHHGRELKAHLTKHPEPIA